jgi:hypothetical protein
MLTVLLYLTLTFSENILQVENEISSNLYLKITTEIVCLTDAETLKVRTDKLLNCSL